MPPDQDPAADGLESAMTSIIAPTEPAVSEPNPFMDGFMSEESAPPAAETETPPAAAETKPDDELPDDAPSQSSDKANQLWKTIKSENKELKKTREQLRTERDERQALLDAREAELAELREKAAKLPDLEQKATLVEEAERKLAIFNVEQSAEWKEVILKPLEVIGTNAEIIAKHYGVSISEMDNALAETDPAKRRELLKAVVAEMDDVDKNEVIQMAKDTQVILSKQATMRERAFEARKELEAVTKENETKAQAEARKVFSTAVDSNVGELKKRVPFVELTAGESADAFFNDVSTKAKAVNFDALAPNAKAFAAAASLLLPRLVKQDAAQKAKIAELEARVAKSNSELPTVSANPETTGSIVKEVDFQNFLS